MSDEREMAVAKEILRLKACEQVLLAIHKQLGIMWGDDPYVAIARLQAASGDPSPAEVVRAWVARDGNGSLWVFDGTVPKWDDRRAEWDCGARGNVSSVDDEWFPTLAPGECWPVEIRRIKE